MRNKFFSWFGLLVAVVLLVAINLLSYTTLRGARVDLTENKVYTLTDGTRNILENLEEPIVLTFYFSQEALSGFDPSFVSYGARVQELLEEYRDASDGMIKLEVIDPEPFSDEEDEAAMSGIQSLPLQQQGTTVFMGLVGSNSVDDMEAITFFDPRHERVLEYQITSLVYSLATPDRPVIGVISTLPVMGDQDAMRMFRQQDQVKQPYQIINQLRQIYEVRDLGTDMDEVDPEVDVLLVVHPKDLSEQTEYAIDQYVLQGRHALIFVDPHAEQEVPESDPSNPMQALLAPRTSTLRSLFEKWGVQLHDEKFVADLENAQKVSVRGVRNVTEAMDYPAYILLTSEDIETEDVVTYGLEALNFASAGSLEAVEGAQTIFEPLILSSQKSMLADTQKIRGIPAVEELLKDFEATDERYVLAARITGNAESAFPDGKPVFDDDEETREPNSNHLSTSKEGINVIVVSDTDLLADRFWVQTQNMGGSILAFPIADNGTLVLNAVENLSGSNDLISVRSRGESRRTFKRVEELAEAAEEDFRERREVLIEKVQESERRLNAMLTQRDEQGVMLTPEQQEAIQQAQAEYSDMRRELRDVQGKLNQDIEALGWQIKFINIAAIPLLVGFYAVALGLFRSVRRKRKR